jgi:hypothetical protein
VHTTEADYTTPPAQVFKISTLYYRSSPHRLSLQTSDFKIIRLKVLERLVHNVKTTFMPALSIDNHRRIGRAVFQITICY